MVVVATTAASLLPPEPSLLAESPQPAAASAVARRRRAATRMGVAGYRSENDSQLRSGAAEPGAAAQPSDRAAQPEPIAAAVRATAISVTVSAFRRPGVNHAGLRAAAHARTPVAAAVAVAAVAMHC